MDRLRSSLLFVKRAPLGAVPRFQPVLGVALFNQIIDHYITSTQEVLVFRTCCSFEGELEGYSYVHDGKLMTGGYSSGLG
jgi:hypothetical protein